MNKLKARYDKGEINDKEATLLRYLSFLPYSGVPFSNFGNWADTVNSLGEKGYIKQKDNNGVVFIYMEPEISDEVFDETGASSENCKEMLESIAKMESDHDNIRANPYLLNVAEFVLKRLGDEVSELSLLYHTFAAECYFALGDVYKASEYYHRHFDLCKVFYGEEVMEQVMQNILNKKDIEE
jgi:tetratricopeptide (TPR) repeat protein